MSFSNFDIYTGRDNSQTWSNSGSGDATLHSTLSDPLASGGDYCRGWRGLNALPYTMCAHHVSITSDVASGAFVGHGTGLALSLRGMLRLGGSDVAGKTGHGLGFHCRTLHSADGRYGESWYGYGFRFSSLRNHSSGSDSSETSGGVPQAALFARTAAGMNETQVVNDPTTSAAWLRSKWYGFRFDYIPTGTSADELKAFLLTGTDMDLEADWTQIASMVIGNGASHYVPQNASHRCGFYFAAGWNGTYSGSPHPDPRPFIDQFSVRQVAL